MRSYAEKNRYIRRCKMATRFDPRISVIRVCAMLSIIAGHWLSMQNINHFQFGAIGVEIFFFVSGYLYSDKKIHNVKDWELLL